MDFTDTKEHLSFVRNWIQLNVKGLDHTIIKVYTKKNAPLRNMMKEFCAATNVSAFDIRFYYKKRKLKLDDTPNSLGMKNGEKIKVYSQLINVVILGIELIEEFNIHRHSPLSMLFKDFCERTDFNPFELRFYYDGNEVKYNDTPKSLDMEEGDRINVYKEYIDVKLKEINQNVEFGRFEPLQYLLCQYLIKNGYATRRLQFRYNDILIAPEDTAFSLEMKDGSEINIINLK